MAKKRRDNPAARPTGVLAATSRWPAEWLTQIAFVMALALVIGRATMEDFSRSRGEPMLSEAPRAAGAGTQIGLDLLCCVPAMLVLARRLSDRTYVLRWSWAWLPLGVLAAWGLLSIAWSADKFGALLGGFHLLAAAAMLWAASQLVRSWLRLRMVGAIFLGLLLAYFTHAVFFRVIDVPAQRDFWEKHKEEQLRERGLAGDPFMAEQFEKRVLAGELMGFFVSPNSMGAMVVMLLVVSAGLGVQRILDDPQDRAGIALLVVVPLSGWMLFYTHSRTALATPVLAAGLLAGVWYGRDWLAARAKWAFWAGVGVVALVTLAVVAHGVVRQSLVHTSLTFRWQYWVGAMRIFRAHPLRGVGLDNFGWYYPAARLPEAAEEVKDPHNFMVKLLVELGVVGALLALAWLGRMAWELTRPVEPIAKPTNLQAYQGPKAMQGIAMIAGVGLLISIVGSIDFSADWGYVLNEVIRKVSLFALLLIGATVAAVKSLQQAQLDDRPAPMLLYAMMVALVVFLVHNLIDFSLFEPGALMTFAFLAGSALGVRQPSVAGRRRRTAVAAVAMAACVVLWLIGMALVWAPTATAEDAANDAAKALRAKRPNEAVRMLNQARQQMPLNADYAFQAAQVLMGGPKFNELAVSLLGQAIARNPMAAEYYLNRARYVARGPEAQQHREQIRADYRRALELNPADASLRVEYADALAALGTPEDKAEAAKQYREAIEWNEKLKADEPKRKSFEGRVGEIRQKVERLQ
jgi:O-antigen ligase